MTLHEYPNVEQRTEEWDGLRLGIVTASAVASLLTISSPAAANYDCPDCGATVGNPCVSRSRKTPTPVKYPHDGRTAVAAERAEHVPPVIDTADNETSRNLTATLVAERVAGWSESRPMTSDMWRGVEHEPIARAAYSEHYAEATEVGFMVRNDWGFSIGYSPDGLVGDDGLIEIKCPRAKTHLATILADEVPAHYMAQLQCGLLVSGREWIDFVSFVGGMPLWRKRVYPDTAWFAAIEEAVTTFETNAARMVADYETATAGLAITERIDNELGLVF